MSGGAADPPTTRSESERVNRIKPILRTQRCAGTWLLSKPHNRRIKTPTERLAFCILVPARAVTLTHRHCATRNRARRLPFSCPTCINRKGGRCGQQLLGEGLDRFLGRRLAACMHASPASRAGRDRQRLPRLSESEVVNRTRVVSLNGNGSGFLAAIKRDLSGARADAAVAASRLIPSLCRSCG